MQALRIPPFRLLFAGRAISYIGTYLAPIAVAFAILDLGGGATAVGLSFAAWTLAQVSMLAVGGVLGDRLPRRLVMIGSDVASTVVRVTMGVLVVSGYMSLASLAGAAVLPVAIAVVGGLRSPLFAVSVVVAAFVFWTHRSNIGRLRRGEEPRFSRKTPPAR